MTGDKRSVLGQSLPSAVLPRSGGRRGLDWSKAVRVRVQQPNGKKRQAWRRAPIGCSPVIGIVRPPQPVYKALLASLSQLELRCFPGAVQADLNTVRGRPVQARVRQARVSRNRSNLFFNGLRSILWLPYGAPKDIIERWCNSSRSSWLLLPQWQICGAIYINHKGTLPPGVIGWAHIVCEDSDVLTIGRQTVTTNCAGLHTWQSFCRAGHRTIMQIKKAKASLLRPVEVTVNIGDGLSVKGPSVQSSVDRAVRRNISQRRQAGTLPAGQA